MKGLEQENKHLGQTVASLRQRCQVGAEARLKDVEKENRVLHESICETTGKLNKMEFEIKQLREFFLHLLHFYFLLTVHGSSEASVHVTFLIKTVQ